MNFEEVSKRYHDSSIKTFILYKYICIYKNHLLKQNLNLKCKKRTIMESISENYKFDKFLYAAFPNMRDISEIDTSTIEQYKTFSISILKNSPKTTNKKIRSIRKLFNYLRDYNKETMFKIKFNPALQVHYIKEIEDKPKYIPRDKLKLIINTMYTSKYGVRNVCITRLLAYSGVRLQEIFNMKVYDINLAKKEFYIKRENIEYTFPMNDSLHMDLSNYTHMRTSILTSIKNPPDALFISRSGTSLTTRAFQYDFKEIIIKCDLKENYTPRNVRASFSYSMAKHVDKDTLKKILKQDSVEHYYVDGLDKNPLNSI